MKGGKEGDFLALSWQRNPAPPPNVRARGGDSFVARMRQTVGGGVSASEWQAAMTAHLPTERLWHTMPPGGPSQPKPNVRKTEDKFPADHRCVWSRQKAFANFTQKRRKLDRRFLTAGRGDDQHGGISLDELAP